MKRFEIVLLMLCLLSISAVLKAQTNDGEGLYTASLTATVGSAVLYDDYLSPLDYLGWKTQLQFDYGRYFKASQQCNLSWFNRWNVGYASVINRAGTARIPAASFAFAYGMKYHFRPARRLVVTLGGAANLDFMIKYGSRNVNNPASADGAVDVGINAGVSYLIQQQRLVMRVSYNLETPMLGAVFVPEMGESYYEMYLGNLHNVAHFASFHNRLALNGELNCDFVLKHTILRLQLQHHHAAWHANNLYFCRAEWLAGVGFVFNFKPLGGKRSLDAPTLWQ
ncbi:MAG: DUF3316 domain-containing protein [Bacteroidales bacterium]|nr:DUF3316 domain-containing protein [Bacteroidales bacterium]